jgi:Recombination endonuclease VII
VKKDIQVTDEFLAKHGHTRESYNKLSKSGRWSVRNREKHYEICKKTIAKNKEHYSKRHRKYLLSKSYGITEEDYNAMLMSQNYCCAICGTDKPTGKWKVFAVDHDHETGQVRELLCNECNRGIGLLKDSPELLIKAADYLLKHKNK